MSNILAAQAPNEKGKPNTINSIEQIKKQREDRRAKMENMVRILI